MKPLLYLLALAILFPVIGHAAPAVAVKPKGAVEESAPPVEDAMAEFGEVNVEEFLELTPKKIRERTGERLSLKEAIMLKVAQKKVRKWQAQGEQDTPEPKSQVVAFILVLLVGFLGIHRFYLGYTTIGIIQLLTLGGCGIWALIDLIRIVIGDLKPKDGSEYDPKL